MSKGSKRRPGKGYEEGYELIWGEEPLDTDLWMDSCDHPGWDVCDEHESVFISGDDCPECFAAALKEWRE